MMYIMYKFIKKVLTMSNYLSFFPKPLLEDIIKGECLPIIGSGFSLNAEMPKDVTMPLWNDLGKKFAKYLNEYDPADNALEIISAYCHKFTRNDMIRKLRTFLNIDRIEPGKTHKLFAELPFTIVCTTNFDNLLENSYSICKPIVVAEEERLSVSHDGEFPLIIKLHGDFDHLSQLIVTEDDYDLFEEKNPLMTTYMSYLLIVKTPLFIGYSIDDPDLRQIFKVVGERLGSFKRPAYVITVNAKEKEIAKYERRGVKVIDIKGRGLSYSSVFPDLFKELKQYLNDNVLKNSTISQSETKKQLLHKEPLQNRLCYFSISHADLSLYQEFVFPLVRKYGLIPLSIDEVVTVGDTILSKINAMIDKAKLIICDISGNNRFGLQEFGMALTYPGKKILLIADEESASKVPPNYIYIRKDQDLKFIGQVDSWLKTNSEDMYKAFSDEPMRLLEKGEPRAAFVSAFSLLEIELNHLFERDDNPQESRVIPIWKLIDDAYLQNKLNKEQFQKLQYWLRIRNKIVHTKESESEKITPEMVRAVMEIIETIRKAH